MKSIKAQQLTILVLLYIGPATIHFEIINSPISICLRIILQIVFIARIAATCVSAEITINSKFETLSMNLQNPHSCTTS